MTATTEPTMTCSSCRVAAPLELVPRAGGRRALMCRACRHREAWTTPSPEDRRVQDALDRAWAAVLERIRGSG
jgi:hypothetical protein